MVDIESRDERSKSALWGLPFITGLGMAIVGIICIASAFIAGIASMLVFGALLAIAGLWEAIQAIRGKKPAGLRVLLLLSGILSVVAGVLLMTRPLAGLAVATILIAAYFFASGLFRGITAIMDRYPKWGWDVAYAVAAIALGVIALVQFPLSAVYLVGLLVGLEILFRGVTMMAAALAVRKVVRQVPA